MSPLRSASPFTGATMLASQRALAATQLSRNSFVEVAESPAPIREAALESYRRRNATLDALFYDVGKVADAEARKVASSLAREGSILVVPPTGAGELVHCPTLHDFAVNSGADV